ncbi:ABC transporter permease [Anatilimnocola sp. NA78]|uniref:ABC transporter permease n=1 Tax=Anatilimnocola sp. NA78 TaxID=3415683 RepID=UPI003CE503E8
MTTASDALQPDQPAKIEGNDAPILATATNPLWPRIERVMEAISERMNPILVKEARQAMKSKQFSVTFSLLLMFGWLYTVFFVVVNLPGVFYSPFGPLMLVGYYLILAVPLLIVVPYASFRSLAAELEDGTFDLLSITALSARQIVTGKLGSSVLQMMVYYSALAPCIAFTYLLRGIDVVTIALLLTYTFLASLMLSILALTLSTVTRARHWQVLLSVLLVIALLLFGFFWCLMMFGIIEEAQGMPYDQPEWWMVNAMIISFYVPLAILFVLIAAGQVTFASENRSTGVRVVLMVLQALIVGWTLYWYLLVGQDEVLMVGAAWITILWAVAGAFLIGETAELSPRARRELPQSVLGRMAFTWFNPGSGTGYVFALLNALGGMLTLALIAQLAVTVTGVASWNGPYRWNHWWIVMLSYLAIYLGLARLCGIVLQWWRMGGMLGTFISYLVLLIMGVIGPFALQVIVAWITDEGLGESFEYTLLQVPNWVWTIYKVGENTNIGLSGSWEVAPYLLAPVATLVFLFNFLLAAKEVEQTRLVAPQRVRDDDEELHPTTKAPKRGPWDEAPAAP